MVRDMATEGSSMLKEFRDFAIKGNVVDLAVGVIIGAAFQKIVDSFVKDVLTPPLSILTGQTGSAFRDKTLDFAGVSIRYGAFINEIISFFMVALAVFLFVKAINTARARFIAQEAAAPAAPTMDQQLLTEIRDLLKSERVASSATTSVSNPSA